MSKSEASRTGWYFLGIVILAYVVTIFLRPGFFLPAMDFFREMMIKILPIFLLVFLIMFITNYFVSPKRLSKYLGKDGGIKSWLIVIGGGLISTGPIYMWYPMLSELKEKGMRQGLIATFLYARAVKPALIPLMLVYFGLVFTILVTVLILLFSVLQGKTIEMMTGGKE